MDSVWVRIDYRWPQLKRVWWMWTGCPNGHLAPPLDWVKGRWPIWKGQRGEERASLRFARWMFCAYANMHCLCICKYAMFVHMLSCLILIQLSNTTSIWDGLIPISSSASRMAVLTKVSSPSSSIPPGRQISPPCGGTKAIACETMGHQDQAKQNQIEWIAMLDSSFFWTLRTRYMILTNK